MAEQTTIQSSDYINGSDLLMKIGTGAVGHCTDFSVTLSSETKDRAVKPLASVTSKTTGLWKGKGVTGLSISVSFNGLRTYTETENGYTEISKLWGKGERVQVVIFERGQETTPIVKGYFVIDTIEMQTPAGNDVTYSGSLSNDGEPEIYPKATA